ncbi:MAG: HAD family hydrolase [Balneolaceae bacterium]|nr:HAD family hydrolase [Balneolaceae bacterium]
MGKEESLVSVDFWNTLVKAETGGKKRREVRYEALCKVADSYIDRLPKQEVEEASRLASEKFNNVWFEEQRTPTTEELISDILNTLGIPATQQELDFLEEQFQQSLLEGPPEIAEGVREVLPELREKYSLALISDTMYSPGKVIRSYLETENLIDYFSSFVFSDEEGYSKPNPKAYHKVLEETNSRADRSYHVGDLLVTDIRGAKNVGMKAILFTGISGDKSNDEIEPDHRCASWEEIRELLI